MRFVVMAAAAVAMMTACASAEQSPQPAPVDLTPQSGYQIDATVLEYKGVTFRAGDHVVTKGRAGRFNPKDTGHSIEVTIDPDKTGIVLGVSKGRTTVLLIRFDEQVWRDTSSSNAEVTLKAFEATIHADYLEPVKK